MRSSPTSNKVETIHELPLPYPKSLRSLTQYLGLAEKARKAYKQWFSRESKTDTMQGKAGKVSKTLAQIKFHVPTIPHRTAIIREFLLTIWREPVRRKSMGKISGTSTVGTI
jgi:hypothetical protein